MGERKYIAISIKHTAPTSNAFPVLWGGYGKSADDDERCFSGYTANIDKAEVYSLEDFRQHYGNGIIKCDEPVAMSSDYVRRYKKWDTVLVDQQDLRRFLQGFKKPVQGQAFRKPGDVMWFIRPDWNNDLEIAGAVFVAENSECAILVPNPFGYPGCISQYLISNSRRNRGIEVYALPINDVYATRDEAVAALAKKKENA